jgi:hypothetical protein
MHRPGLALALVAFAGPSFAASPDPAALEASPEIQVRSRALVRKLGGDDFAEREEAQKQLAALGRLARPALLDGVNASPDAEVRLRCAELLPAANALDLKARIETFLADADGKYEHDLPGWKAFRATASGEWSFFGQPLWSNRARQRAAREVFTQLIAHPDNRRLVVATAGSPVELSEMTFDRRQDLTRRRAPRDEDEPRRDPTLEDVTALLFAESVAGSQYVPRRGSVSFLLSSSGFYGAARGADEKSRVYRAVAAAWLNSRSEPREMYQAMSIAVSLELTDESCAIAARLVTMPGVTSSFRGRAASHLIDYGSSRHLRLLEPALSNTLVVYAFRESALTEGVPEVTHEIQLRDLALAVSIQLAGKRTEDFGFLDRYGAVREGYGFAHSRNYFRDDEARKKAFEKWAEWRKGQAAK